MERANLSKDFWRPTAIVVAACCLLGFPSLYYPFGADQSNQGLIAQRILAGDILYTDIGCLKPPLTIAFHWVALVLFGNSMTSVRILDLIWTALTSFVLFLLGKRFTSSNSTATIIGIAYPLFYFSLNYWHTAQTDGWMNLPIVTALWLATFKGSASSKVFHIVPRWYLIGVFVSAALLFKYTILALIPGLVIYILFEFWQQTVDLRKALFGFCLGLLSAFFLCALFLMLWGAWDGFVNDHLMVIFRYTDTANANPTPSSSLIFGIIDRLTNFGAAFAFMNDSPTLLWLGPIGLLVCLRHLQQDQNERQRILLLWLWVGAAWASTAIQALFVGYHFSPLIAPWSLAMGWVLKDLYDVMKPKVSRHTSRVVLVFSALLLFWLLGFQRTVNRPYESPEKQWILIDKILGGVSKKRFGYQTILINLIFIRSQKLQQS